MWSVIGFLLDAVAGVGVGLGAEGHRTGGAGVAKSDRHRAGHRTGHRAGGIGAGGRLGPLGAAHARGDGKLLAGQQRNGVPARESVD